MTDFRTVMQRHGFGHLKAVAPIKPAPVVGVRHNTSVTVNTYPRQSARYHTKWTFDGFYMRSPSSGRTWT